MLVILRENVENLGRIGDMVKVSDGYARNFLMPRGMVVMADEANQARIAHERKSLEKKRQAQRAAATEIAAKLAEVTCNIPKKVGENDKIFGSVSTNDIAQALKKLGLAVEKRMIQIDNPIRALGVHNVTVRLEPEVSAQLKVWVVKEA